MATPASPPAPTVQPTQAQERPAPAVDPKLTALKNIPPGTRCRLVHYGKLTDPRLIRRFQHLGLTPGTQLELTQRAPLKDPAIYRIAGCDMALRERDCGTFGVEILP